MKFVLKFSYLKKTIIAFTALAISIFIIDKSLYPTMVCKGTYSELNKWTSDNNPKDIRVIDDKREEVRWSFLIRRDAIYVNEERFPLYKEFNHKNIHAEKTQFGFKGRYLINFIQHYDYGIEYNNITHQLSVSVEANAPHILDGEVGKDKLRSSFIGDCERRWF